MTQIGVVAIRRPYRDPVMNVAYTPGDTLLLLDYLGEGFYNAWYRGRMRQVAEYWSDSSTSEAKLVVEPRDEWWALVSWRDGATRRRGWIDMREVGVGGADACG